MGSGYAKPTSARLVKKNRSHSRHQSSSYLQSRSVLIISGVLLLALAASSLAFCFIYTLPSLKVLLFEAIPNFWRSCSSVLFTPTNLFVMLNLIILSILAMARLHAASPAAHSPSSSLQLPKHGDGTLQQNPERGNMANRSLSETHNVQIRYTDLQLADHAEESEGEQMINDQADDRDIDEAVNTGLMVLKEEGHELQQGAGVSGCFQTEEQKADHSESRKAKKAQVCAFHESAPSESRKAGQALSSGVQGDPLPPSSHDYIDALLCEESSIFTLAQNRPLPSARFTHRKGPKLSGHERPLSPLKMSRPILKRGDTLDATWRAICESKRHSSPLHSRHQSKHTRKVDTNEEIIEGSLNKSRVSSPSMKAFQGTNLAKGNHPVRMREPSMPQEELNAKVESFISRFNEQIRIQRKKSLLDYMEMVNRGSK